MGYVFCLRQVRKRIHVWSFSFLPLDSVRLADAGISCFRALNGIRRDAHHLLAVLILGLIQT
jgi:hypothetical protein